MSENQNAEPAVKSEDELSPSMKYERESDHPVHATSENAQAVDGGVTSDPQINPQDSNVNTEASLVVPTNDSVDENDSAEPNDADIQHNVSAEDIEAQK